MIAHTYGYKIALRNVAFDGYRWRNGMAMTSFFIVRHRLQSWVLYSQVCGTSIVTEMGEEI